MASASDQRGREQPRDLGAEVGVEETRSDRWGPMRARRRRVPPTLPLSLPVMRPKPL